MWRIVAVQVWLWFPISASILGTRTLLPRTCRWLAEVTSFPHSKPWMVGGTTTTMDWNRGPEMAISLRILIPFIALDILLVTVQSSLLFLHPQCRTLLHSWLATPQ